MTQSCKHLAALGIGRKTNNHHNAWQQPQIRKTRRLSPLYLLFFFLYCLPPLCPCSRSCVCSQTNQSCIQVSICFSSWVLNHSPPVFNLLFVLYRSWFAYRLDVTNRKSQTRIGIISICLIKLQAPSVCSLQAYYLNTPEPQPPQVPNAAQNPEPHTRCAMVSFVPSQPSCLSFQAPSPQSHINL